MVGLRAQREVGEEAVASRALRRLNFHPREHRSEYFRFAALPSNLAALESALLFSTGLTPFVAVSGCTGWGKSQILRIAAEHVQLETNLKVKVRSAGQYLLRRGRWDMPGPLILDDAQLCLQRPRERQVLRNALELRSRLGRPTMLTFACERSSKAMESCLPQLHRWSVAHIPAPGRLERQVVLRQLARAEGIELSDRLFSLLSTMINGNGHSLLGAIQRLGLLNNAWFGLENECLALGTVHPYLAADWDLRRLVDRCIYETTEPLGLDFCPDLARCVSIHFMRRLFAIPEEDVARFYRIEPGEVFSHEHVFSLALMDPKVSRLRAICLEALDQSLALI